jgi:signal-transduction protein with cAMP-binding, CBS, and nucleotidyltransferase domain
VRNDAECTQRAGRSALVDKPRGVDHRVMDATHAAPISIAALRLPPPVWLDEDATLGDAARVMVTASVSAVIVGQDAAIVTERDVVRALAHGESPDAAIVKLATHDTIRFPEEGPVFGALAEMLHAGVRHLVVVGTGGLPCAVLPLSAAAAFVLDASEIPSWLSALRIVLRLEER